MSKGSKQRPYDAEKFYKNYEAIFGDKSKLKSDDFYQVGCRGMNLNTESEYKPSPCEGCQYRQRCTSEQLACKRYVAYSMNTTYSKPASFYMEKDCIPSRELFEKVWGSV